MARINGFGGQTNPNLNRGGNLNRCANDSTVELVVLLYKELIMDKQLYYGMKGE